MKPEFERRAAGMKANNLARRQFRAMPSPRSIFAPPRVDIRLAKVHFRDFLADRTSAS